MVSPTARPPRLRCWPCGCGRPATTPGHLESRSLVFTHQTVPRAAGGRPGRRRSSTTSSSRCHQDQRPGPVHPADPRRAQPAGRGPAGDRPLKAEVTPQVFSSPRSANTATGWCWTSTRSSRSTRCSPCSKDLSRRAAAGRQPAAQRTEDAAPGRRQKRPQAGRPAAGPPRQERPAGAPAAQDDEAGQPADHPSPSTPATGRTRRQWAPPAASRNT